LGILVARDWVGLLEGCGHVRAVRRWLGVGLGDGGGGDVINMTGGKAKSGPKLVLWEDTVERSKG